MNELQFQEQNIKDLGGNRLAKTHGNEVMPKDSGKDIVSFEKENGIPYVGEILKLNAAMDIDADVAEKVGEVDSYIKKYIAENGLKESTRMYYAVLQELIGKEKISVSDGASILDKLFRGIALQNKLSGKSYLKKVKERSALESRRISLATMRNKLKELSII